MRFISVIILILLFTVKSFSQDVKFEIENAGLTVEGSFNIVSNEITYNEQDPTKSKFISVIAVKSISTGIGLRDEHLMKAAYFDQKKYPFMKFVSKEVRVLPNNRLLVKGDLTIKNVTKTISLEVSVKEEKSGHRFSFKIPINRRDYTVGGNSLTISDFANVAVDVFVAK